MNICFFGVGGVGGYFGSLVTKASGTKHDIHFIARGKHKEAIIKQGLTLKRSGGEEIITARPKMCTDSITDLPVCDLIIISVKSYDLAHATDDLKKIASDNTIILPLLNGVDIYERIREYLSSGIVLPSCVYVGTHIESPGVIYQKGGSCKIHIGPDPRFPEYLPESLFTILKASQIEFSWEEQINVAIWSKFMFIAAYGLVGAAYQKTLGEILDNKELSNMVKAIMREIETIAQNLTITLDSSIVETSFLRATQFPYEAKTSFHRDVEIKGRINEGDLFGGTLIRYGKSLDIPTPAVTSVFDTLMTRLH